MNRALVHLNIDYSFDSAKLKEACLKLHIPEPYISDVGFCPHLVAYQQTFKNVEEVMVSNVNEGRYNTMVNTPDIELVDCKDLKNFVIEIYNLKYGCNKVDNALF